MSHSQDTNAAANDGSFINNAANNGSSIDAAANAGGSTYAATNTSTNASGSADAATDVRFMALALEQAHIAADMGEVPIGAVVVCDGEVVAQACNRREIDADPAAHAEFLAMEEAARTLGRWRLSGCTIYVTLEPCLMCAGLMHQARISRCVYAATDPKAGALGTLYNVAEDTRLNHNFSVTAGVMQEEASALLKSFFANLRSRRADSQSAHVAQSAAPLKEA